LISSLLTHCSLCPLHSAGKKHLFIEFIKKTRTDIEASVKEYCASIDNTQFYRFIKTNISTEVALAIISQFYEVKAIDEVVKKVFAGKECEYDLIFGPIATDCQGNALTLLPPYGKALIYSFDIKLMRSMSNHGIDIINMDY
jgi:hypothetical protein